ncbi:MAG: DMT family transporter [Eubacteriales bacterium]
MAYIQLIVAMLIWGSIGLFVKEIPLLSTEIVMARVIFGAIFLGTVLIFKKEKSSRKAYRKNLSILILSGISMVLNWMFLFEAFKHTTVSSATLVYYTAPIIVILLSQILFKERLTIAKVIGVCCSFIGMILVNFTGGSEEVTLIGFVLAFMAAFFYAGVMILNKYVKGMYGIEITLMQLVGAAIVIIPFVVLTHEGEWVMPSTTIIVLLIVVGVLHTGVACFLYFSSIQKLPAQSVALCSYIDPVSAILLSAIVLQEQLVGLQIIGAILILGGAAMGELWRKKSQ